MSELEPEVEFSDLGAFFQILFCGHISAVNKHIFTFVCVCKDYSRHYEGKKTTLVNWFPANNYTKQTMSDNTKTYK